MSEALIRGSFLSTSEQLDAERRRALQRRLEALERRNLLGVQTFATSSSSSFSWVNTNAVSYATWAGASLTIPVSVGAQISLVLSFETTADTAPWGAVQIAVVIPTGGHDLAGPMLLPPDPDRLTPSATIAYPTYNKMGPPEPTWPGPAVVLRPTAAGTYTYTFGIYVQATAGFNVSHTVWARNLDVRAYVLS